MDKNPPTSAGNTGSIPGPEDPTCSGANNLGTTVAVEPSLGALEPGSSNHLALMLQLLKHVCPRACALQ